MSANLCAMARDLVYREKILEAKESYFSKKKKSELEVD